MRCEKFERVCPEYSYDFSLDSYVDVRYTSQPNVSVIKITYQEVKFKLIEEGKMRITVCVAIPPLDYEWTEGQIEFIESMTEGRMKQILNKLSEKAWERLTTMMYGVD